MTAPEKFRYVMREFKNKELVSGGSGDIVTKKDQALAIAFSEAQKIEPSYGRYEGGGDVFAVGGDTIKKKYLADDYFPMDDNYEFMFDNKVGANRMASDYGVSIIEEGDNFYVPIAKNKMEEGGEVEYIKETDTQYVKRNTNSSYKIAKAYDKLRNSEWTDADYEKYRKVVKSTQIPSDELRKIEDEVSKSNGNFRMIDIYQFWSIKKPSNKMEEGGVLKENYVIKKGSRKVDSFYLTELPIKSVFESDATEKEKSLQEPKGRFGVYDRVIPSKMFPIRNNSWVTFSSKEEAENYIKQAEKEIEEDERFNTYVKSTLLNYLKTFKVEKKSFAEEGGVTLSEFKYDPNIDYFSEYDLLPKDVYDVLMDVDEDDMDTYEGLNRLSEKLKPLGWTFDSYVSGDAYGLRPIGEPLQKMWMKDGGTITSTLLLEKRLILVKKMAKKDKKLNARVKILEKMIEKSKKSQLEEEKIILESDVRPHLKVKGNIDVEGISPLYKKAYLILRTAQELDLSKIPTERKEEIEEERWEVENELDAIKDEYSPSSFKFEWSYRDEDDNLELTNELDYGIEIRPLKPKTKNLFQVVFSDEKGKETIINKRLKGEMKHPSHTVTAFDEWYKGWIKTPQAEKLMEQLKFDRTYKELIKEDFDTNKILMGLIKADVLPSYRFHDFFTYYVSHYIEVLRKTLVEFPEAVMTLDPNQIRMFRYGGIVNKHRELKEFEKEIEGKDGYIQDVITIPNNKWMVYYADNSGMTTRTNTKVIPKL